MGNFAKEVIALLKGDEEQKVAVRNERKAHSAIKSQIASLESQIVDREFAVEESVEALKLARYPTKDIKDPKAYLKEVLTAKLLVENLELELEDSKQFLIDWQSEMGILFSES